MNSFVILSVAKDLYLGQFPLNRDASLRSAEQDTDML
jgi:hypothetical protein